MHALRSPSEDEPRPLDRSSPLPLWAQLLSELERRHAAGAFASQFPTDKELTESYAVSRQTVRDAVRKLGDRIGLDRQRGRGTFVRAEFQQPVGALYSLFQAIEAQGVEQRSLVLAKDLRQDAVAAEDLGISADATVVYLERLRLAGGLPLAMDRIWLPADLAEAVLAADFDHAALYDELWSRCGVRPSRGEEHIRPVVPEPEEAHALGIEAGGAAFSVERRTWVGDRLLERRHTLVRGDRYAFVTSWATGGPHAAGAQLSLVGDGRLGS
ncbi:MAG TPA: GntR family transcriptional regulator [Actinomycetota bacterium]|nr:GntR family transcriptional regulator [Actinomycetota bacterium]